MAWQDRIRQAAYTSSSGVYTAFDYEDVSKTIDKKTASFTFPDADGTYVQDLGHTGRRYPLRVIFWGDDHDEDAERFEGALLERGIGVLTHPLYGTLDVIPFGAISFRSDLKTAANQTIIDITFWETIGLVYPTSQVDPASAVVKSVDEYNAAAAETLDATADIDSAVEQATFKAQYNALLGSVKSGLDAIASVQENVEKTFNAINDSINNGIDTLISQPLTLAFQTVQLIQAPARAITAITARLEAYKNLGSQIIDNVKAISIPGLDSANSNEYHTKDMYASTYITGAILSTVNNQFTTKSDALLAADSITQQMDNLQQWRDDNLVSLSQIDTGEAYQKLQEAVALTIGFLVEISFTLKQERRIILQSPHTVIDLIAELYPVNTIIDDEIDFFINSNMLNGDEILELPRGRELVYYV